ncbi:MAG: ATP-binding cassette domain-containing protein, partial [Actinomycetota bacterium]
MKTEKFPGRLPLPVSRGHFELADVSLDDDDRSLLVDVSVMLKAGSITYVLGPSSEERSALLRLLLGVEALSSGVVRLDGADLEDLPLAEARERIALALSEPWLTDGTIADNIAFGQRAVDREQIVRAAKLACVDSFCADWDLGLDTVVTEEAPELTVGQRRLVALARAVVRQPSVLLIEEPTLGLDAQEETLAIKALQRVAKGRTTVVAAHRLHYARRPDRLLRLERGHLVEEPAAPSEALVAPSTGWSGDRDSRRLDTHQPVGALSDGAHSATPHSGPEIEGFQPVRLLERSSYTETWLAWHEADSKRVQLKVARRTTPVTYAALEELSREFRTAESLRHPGLARPIAANFGAANPYAVYEYIDGQTLAELIEFQGRDLPPGVVLRIGYELARTLTYIHQRGYAHLDLRPEIVMVSPHGAIITDLKMVQPKGTETKRIYRQDQYGVVAAEQLRGRPAAASMDLFALGAVLYQAANGLLATDWPGTLNSHRHLVAVDDPPALPATTEPDPARAEPATGGAEVIAIDRARTGEGSTAAARAALEQIIERLTASDPAARPKADEALSLLR